MTPSEIKPDMKFGHWQVIKFDHINDHRVKYFLCKCDVCGKIKPVRATDLINGISTSCSKECSTDIVGLQFGRWTVLKRDKSQPGYYYCRCECGTIKSVYGSTLKIGASKSCGCLKIEKTKQYFEEKAQNNIGKTYGLLNVKNCFLKNNNYYYNCEC